MHSENIITSDYPENQSSYAPIEWITQSNSHDNMRKEIMNARRQYHVPGIAVACIENRHCCRLYCEGYAGSRKEPITVHTCFQVASLSKPVTAWGIARLYSDEIIMHTEAAQKSLSRIRLPAEHITINQLLSHTAGFLPVSYAGNHRQPEQNWIPRLQRMVEQKYDLNMMNCFVYSGLGYSVLQVLVEDVTGLSFSRYMQDYILRPMGMRNSIFSQSEISQHVYPHSVLGIRLKNRYFQELAAAGLYSSVKDFCKFIIHNLQAYQQETVLGIKSNYIQTFHSRVARTIPYGYGFEVHRCQGKTFISHSGSNFGWHSFFTLMPEQEKGLVIMTNGNGGTNSIVHILTAWLSDYITEAVIQTAEKISGFTHTGLLQRSFKEFMYMIAEKTI